MATTGYVRQSLKYLVSLAVAAALLYWVFRNVALEELWARMLTVNGWLLGASIVMGLVSHIIRAYRWNLLLEPLQYKPDLGRTFLAVMIAYVSNLVIPRLGEVARCGFLDRKAGVPVAQGFGTVVVERLVDLLALVVLMVVLLAVQLDRLLHFFEEQFAAKGQSFSLTGVVLGLLVGGVLLLVGSMVWYRKGGKEKLKGWPLYQKVAPTLLRFGEGLLSIRNLKNPGRFWLATLGIWILYYGMTHVVILAFPATNHLGWVVGLAVLVVGGFGMAAPVQGGFGAYHFLVANLLIIYAIPEDDGKIFAAILHSSQTLFVIVAGGLCLLIGFLLPRVDSSTKPAEDARQD